MFRRLAHAYRDQKGLLATIAGLSILSAGTEALALISIAPLVQSASEGSTRYDGSIGPWSISLSLIQLAWFSAAMLLTALAVQALTGYVTSRLTSGYSLRTRLEVVNAYQSADWNVQSQEHEGWLRTLSSDNVSAAAEGLESLAAWLKGAIGVMVFLIGAIVVNFVAVLLITIVLGLVILGIRPINHYVRRLGENTRHSLSNSVRSWRHSQ